MREAALVVVLEHRAGLDDEPELGAITRRLIAADVIAQAVRQRADGDPRIVGDLRVEGGSGGVGRRDLAENNRRGRRCDAKGSRHQDEANESAQGHKTYYDAPPAPALR